MKPNSVETRYDATGRTDDERNALIMKLWKSGLDYRRIAAEVGMSKSGVFEVVRRLRGRPRNRSAARMDEIDGWIESEWYAPEPSD